MNERRDTSGHYAPRVVGAPLLNIMRKSPPHVAGWGTRRIAKRKALERHLASFGEFRRGRV